MLTQVNHWIDIIATIIDVVLVLRILQLKLHPIYVFITLSCVLSVFFDGLMLWYHSDSREFGRILIYSRFLYAFVLPAAAFDVWEEVKAQVVRIRRLALLRLFSSMLVAGLLGLIIVGFGANTEDSSETVVATFAIVVWAAASTASLAFLWSVHRLSKAQKTILPPNTSVWLRFFQLSLAAEVLMCFLIIMNQQFGPFVNDLLDLLLGLYSLLITLWCIWRLQTADVDVTAQNADLG